MRPIRGPMNPGPALTEATMRDCGAPQVGHRARPGSIAPPQRAHTTVVVGGKEGPVLLDSGIVAPGQDLGEIASAQAAPVEAGAVRPPGLSAVSRRPPTEFGE